MRLSPVLIKEDSGQTLTSVQFTSPYLFGEMPNDVLATTKDDQILAREADTSLKLPRKWPAYQFISCFLTPPSKRMSSLQRGFTPKGKGLPFPFGSRGSSPLVRSIKISPSLNRRLSRKGPSHWCTLSVANHILAGQCTRSPSSSFLWRMGSNHKGFSYRISSLQRSQTSVNDNWSAGLTKQVAEKNIGRRVL